LSLSEGGTALEAGFAPRRLGTAACAVFFLGLLDFSPLALSPQRPLLWQRTSHVNALRLRLLFPTTTATTTSWPAIVAAAEAVTVVTRVARYRSADAVQQELRALLLLPLLFILVSPVFFRHLLCRNPSLPSASIGGAPNSPFRCCFQQKRLRVANQKRVAVAMTVKGSCRRRRRRRGLG